MKARIRLSEWHDGMMMGKERVEGRTLVSIVNVTIPLSSDFRARPTAFTNPALKLWGIGKLLLTKSGVIAFEPSDRVKFQHLATTDLAEGLNVKLIKRKGVSGTAPIDRPNPRAALSIRRDRYHVHIHKADAVGATITGPGQRELAIEFID